MANAQCQVAHDLHEKEKGEAGKGMLVKFFPPNTHQKARSVQFRLPLVSKHLDPVLQSLVYLRIILAASVRQHQWTTAAENMSVNRSWGFLGEAADNDVPEFVDG